MKSTQERRIILEMNLGEILPRDQSKELEKYRWQKKKLQWFRGECETCVAETTNKMREIENCVF